MPASLSYPGVYIEEVPSSVRTITGVSTSIAAFIDFFKEGPMDEAVQILSMADFERVFGGLDRRSEASYAIMQFFLNGGSQAYVIRTASKAEKAAIKEIHSKASGGEKVLSIKAINEGEWGNNLRVDIDYHNVPDKHFNLYVIRYSGPSGQAKPIVTEEYLALSVNPNNPRYFQSVINDQSKLIRVHHESNEPNLLPAPTGTISEELSSLEINDLNGMAGKTLTVKIGDSDDQTATLENWNPNEVQTLAQLRGKLEKAIREADSSSESFSAATVEIMGDSLRVLSGKASEHYNPTEIITIKNDGSGLATTLKLNSTSHRNVQEYQLGAESNSGAMQVDNGGKGKDGDLPGANQLVGNQSLEPPTGMYALNKAGLFNILCIPRAADLNSAEMTAVVSKAIKYCEEKRAFMIIDIPKEINEVQEIKDWLDSNAGFRHKNAAIYFPRLKIPDPLNNYRLRSIKNSGTMAGVYAKTDAARGVWKAPAGIDAKLAGVSDLDIKLTDAQNGVLNPLGINCLRTFPVYGSTAWGARTLVGANTFASEWKYIPVRRLALMLEESLFRGTKWVLFEPNDEPLWAQIRLNIGAFMQGLFRQGAFQGGTPREAYLVKCDSETTTQDDINKGIVNIVVGFAPLKPAEFVIIKIQQLAGQVAT